MSEREDLIELANLAKSTGDSDLELKALERLDALGSIETKETPEVRQETQPQGRGLARQALQGLTFGTSDELGAVAAGIPASFATSDGFIEGVKNIPSTISNIHKSLQEERKQFKQQSPKSALAAELAGGLLTGGVGAGKVMASQAVSKASPLAKTLALSGTGAAEGGLYGFTSGDQGDRLRQAGIGAASGAIGAPALNVAGKVSGKLVEPVINRFKSSMKSPQREGVEYLADVLSREGYENLDEVMKPARGDNVFLSDLTQGGRGALEGIVQHIENPSIRKMATEAFNKRNQEQQSRIFKNVQERFGIDPEMTVKNAVNQVSERRANRATPFYRKAEQKPIVMTNNIKAHLNPQTGTEEVLSAFQTAQRRMRTRQNAGENVNQFTLLDEMKKNMDDQIENLWKNGYKRRAGDLIKIKNSIIKDIDDQNPDYKQAREIWAGESALIDAAERGKNILREDVDYLDDLVDAMGESEKEMFRLGAMKAIREKLMQAREGTNSVNRIASELNLDRIKRAFPSDKAFKEFKKDLKFEADIFDTSRVLSNSMTALRQAVQKDMEKGGSGTLREGTTTVQDILTHSAGAIAGALDSVLGRGISIDAKEEMGKVLLTPIKELPPNVMKMLNKEVVKKISPEDRGMWTKIMSDLSQSARRTDVSLPAVGVPAIMNSEE